jgi:catechol 2,3-dioxygenase-like lactoylglutathione lyase family enzyme
MSKDAIQLTYVAPVLRVADLGRSLSYYQDRLGFQIEFNYDGFYVGLLRDGCHVHLKCSAPPERNQTGIEAAEHLDACFGVQDAEGLASGFASAGAIFSVPLRSMPYGKEFYLRDPDGNILGFVQPV